ncbi:BTB domain-containing protein [Caenorhabditis elegans]|uniref:BTB domain-containing protein n=1 Tax=Caenorhabditis elegans TaxID=6239 RepID=G2TRV2_CAEEL|nr:BTB domain-containing protein [Caenorhabditis elegans]CCD31043.1 BTB domain-containing protein [Caenorhabditis elegans]|eukprot:NP_001254338.1 Uncharacterized protein CELE_C50E10.2 [Caenorhabditis elegans]
MNSKYQREDKIATFTDEFECKLGQTPPNWQFCTIFESTVIIWNLELTESDNSYWICLTQLDARDVYPPILKLSMKLNVLNFYGKTQKSLQYCIEDWPLGHRYGVFQWATNFEGNLTALVADAIKNKQTIQVVTHMDFMIDDLSDLDYLMRDDGAPSLPATLEFYFDAFTNQSRHDLKLRTSDGSQFITTSHALLFLTSSYFRENLKISTSDYTVVGVDSLDTIDICLNFMVTRFYKKPAVLSPKLAFDIFTLATQWNVFNPYILTISLKRQLFEELKKNHGDLEYVCNMLIVAEDAKFPNVQSCCIATLVYYHFNDFMRITDGTWCGALCGSWWNPIHPLKGRLVERREGADDHWRNR